MFIQTQETPNPDAFQIIPGVEVLKSGTISITLGDDTSKIPLATALFQIKGVVGIFFTERFITITKAPDTDWNTIRPHVLSCTLDHFTSGMHVMGTPQEEAQPIDELESEIVKQIKEIIENNVRPAVERDGGDIVFVRYVDGIVYLQLKGACSGCPSAAITLKEGIERMLQHYVPEVKSVEQVEQ